MKYKRFLDCDFDLKPTETNFFGSKFKIHRGFLDRYKILRNEIISTINQLGDFSKPLILTGHSLGGVLAILTSLEMNLTYGTDSRAHKVISFGTPKFCCSKLAQNMSSNVIRVSNKNDPMVHIIPYDDFEVRILWFLGPFTFDIFEKCLRPASKPTQKTTYTSYTPKTR